MKKEIKTRQGIFTYSEVPLYHGRKKINIPICKKNLLDFKAIMNSFDVDFGLIFGTLLGAVREHNFIAHDEDVDVYILFEQREKFLTLLWTLENRGFKVARYDGNLLSIIRDNDYIDIYFFKKRFPWRRTCGALSLPNRFFESYEEITFLGETFCVPGSHLKLILRLYGKNWRTPIRGAHAAPLSRIGKIKLWLKPHLPRTVITLFKSIAGNR